MCLDCLRSISSLSRREVLRRASALGASWPFLARPELRAETSAPTPPEFTKSVEDLIARARSPELAGYRIFAIDGADLPWSDLGLGAAKGQQITFLVSGRMWIAREAGLWLGPGLVFHARTRGTRPIYSPGVDTGTMVAAHDGPLEIARSAAQFSDEDGRLRIPDEEYRNQDANIFGVALLWKGDAAAGLASLAEQGDVGGLVSAEIARLKRGRRLPEGWSNYFSLGGGAETFNRSENGEIVCESQGLASIVERPLPLSFAASPKLGWRWKIDLLPSAVAEDRAPFHDYLSIGVKFEDGQDLTYFWSAALPVGKVFRCPLPGWNAIETHMTVASDSNGLGAWRAFERDVAADYAAHIGGPARAISHVWLLAVTSFQRRRGACRYADIRVVTADGTVHAL